MKIHDKLNEVVKYIESARGLPMSSSVLVNKAELTRLLEELRGLLPNDLVEAQAVLDRRERIIAEAITNAERLLVAAEDERRRLVSEEEVLREARIEAGTVLQSARAESEQMAHEIDGYVDAKLAHLEVSITKLLDSVRQGRQHLAEPGLYDELASTDEPETSAESVSGGPYQPESVSYQQWDQPQPSRDIRPENRVPDPLTDEIWPLPRRPVPAANGPEGDQAALLPDSSPRDGSDDDVPAIERGVESAPAEPVADAESPDEAEAATDDQAFVREQDDEDATDQSAQDEGAEAAESDGGTEKEPKAATAKARRRG